MQQAQAGSVNAGEAAEIVGVHLNTILAWLRTGRLSGQRATTEWRIPLAEVERIAAERAELAEAGRGLQHAGELLRSLSMKRWAAADDAWQRATIAALEARSAVVKAKADGASDERLEDLVEAAHDATTAALAAGDRLRSAQEVYGAALDLRAEGLRKASKAGVN